MTNPTDIEDSLNIITYLERYDERYRDERFSLLMKANYRWIVEINNVLLIHEHDAYVEAFAYAMGYIDGSQMQGE